MANKVFISHSKRDRRHSPCEFVSKAWGEDIWQSELLPMERLNKIVFKKIKETDW